jgi:RNA polymerase sigma-70 factor (ECF subfamily)
MDVASVAEAELVTQKPSFAAFYEQTWPDLAGYCQALTGVAELADEIAQDAMARTFVRFPLIREPRPYAYRVATNLVRDQWRRDRRHSLVPSLTDLDRPAPAGTDADLLDAVRRLPRPLREVVLLHYYADLRVEDVAFALHRPVGTVKRRLHEARARLALDLEDSR